MEARKLNLTVNVKAEPLTLTSDMLFCRLRSGCGWEFNVGWMDAPCLFVGNDMLFSVVHGLSESELELLCFAEPRSAGSCRFDQPAYKADSSVDKTIIR